MNGCSEPSQGWELYPHDADIGVRGIGRSMGEAFANAALAMTAAVAPLDRIRAVARVQVTCLNPDPEILFVDWLNAVIYEMATRKMLFRDFHVAAEDGLLRAELAGETVDVARHAPAVEPKGATLTDLAVARDADGCWTAQCVIDV